MTTKSVAEMTVAEFEERVRAIVTQALADLLTDPDKGPELSEWASTRLQQSTAGVTSVETRQDREEPELTLGQWLVENAPRGANLVVPDDEPLEDENPFSDEDNG